MNKRGFIFDMDGVVIDNHSYHFQAWMEFSQRHRFALNADIYRDQFNGKTNADLFAKIFGKIPQEKILALAEEKEGLYRDLYRPHMTPHKGLVDYFDYLRRNKFKIALGTSAPTPNVDFILEGCKLRHYFDVIVDGSEVTKGKPDPEVYLRCCLKLGLEPKECVVFEDSLAGLESGTRAGCDVVGVATSHKASELKSHADKIIFDFTEGRGLIFK